MIIAIDPGITGGIAFWDGRAAGIHNMPDTMIDLKDLLKDLTCDVNCWLSEVKIYMEDVGFHVQGNAASNSVTFGRHCGTLIGICIGLEIPVHMVKPKKWQQAVFGKLPKVKKDRKNKIKEVMQLKFPQLKVTLKTSDAMAILEYARRVEG